MKITGRPTPEETAAVVVVLSAVARRRAAPPPGPTPALPSPWAARSRLLREPVHPAPGAWRASGLPR